MNMQIEMRPESDLLSVHATGEFALEEAKRTFLELMEAVALYKSKQVLFDGRTLVGKPKTMERFYYGEFAAQTVLQYSKRGVSRATQFGYVLREPVLDPRRFGETVAWNRGVRVKAFSNVEDALKWLGIAPQDPDTASGHSPRFGGA